MFRFMIDCEEWILSFSPHLSVRDHEKEIIFHSLTGMSKDFSLFTRGEAFILVNNKIGSIIIEVERIPSNILKVRNIIQREKWYFYSE